MKQLSIPFLLKFAFVASVVSLATAYVSEYGFDFKPCHLCLLQRIPYVVVILLSFLGLSQTRWSSWIVLLIGLTFLAGAGIATYHTAVENQWVKGPSGCTEAETQATQTIDDFLKKIQRAPIVACDQPQWDFHGITMAAMNAAWSLLLGVATFIVLWRIHRAPPAG